MIPTCKQTKTFTLSSLQTTPQKRATNQNPKNQPPTPRATKPPVQPAPGPLLNKPPQALPGSVHWSGNPLQALSQRRKTLPNPPPLVHPPVSETKHQPKPGKQTNNTPSHARNTQATHAPKRKSQAQQNPKPQNQTQPNTQNTKHQSDAPGQATLNPRVLAPPQNHKNTPEKKTPQEQTPSRKPRSKTPQESPRSKTPSGTPSETLTASRRQNKTINTPTQKTQTKTL